MYGFQGKKLFERVFLNGQLLLFLGFVRVFSEHNTLLPGKTVLLYLVIKASSDNIWLHIEVKYSVCTEFGTHNKSNQENNNSRARQVFDVDKN
jgi:hypothetical protein